jgi:peptide chain release factor
MDIPLPFQSRLDRLGVRAADIEESFIRGSGPGGQKINKTSSTVRLRHRPTGIDVRCQAERTQASNREQAWQQLCEKLEARAKDARTAAQQIREKTRRQTRQKSRGQKVRMIQAKQHRAKYKARRGRVGPES